MDANTSLLILQDKVPSESLPLLQDKLKNASNEQLDKVAITPLKNPLVGLILGVILGMFGIDRFYQGNMTLGIAKLVITILGIATFVIIVGAIILFLMGFWYLADLYLVWKSIKNDNLDKILMQL